MATKAEWRAETSCDEVKARARGRKHWNVTQRVRAQARRVRVAKRLTELQAEAFAAGRLEWRPRGVIAQLATEFGCTRQTISQDLKAIDAWPVRPPAAPRKQLRDPRWTWAYRRPRPTHLPRRMGVRLPEELYQQLLARGDPSRLMRQALEAFLDSGSHHTQDDCALVVAKALID